MGALYNEIDPFAAQWLRNLVTAGHIASGVVDERSIKDLAPDDVAGPGQRHFFAGIAGWCLALRLAGVPDDANIWTGSCPCQPFSDAGRGRGVDDDRHLWPEWFRLIRECLPALVFGEQVASRAGLAWLDVVHADMEGAGYTVRAADLCAASVGAPHRRQRLFFVAYADGQHGRLLASQWQPGRANAQAERRGEADRMADVECARLEVLSEQHARREQSAAQRGGSTLGVADPQEERRGARWIDGSHGRTSLEPVRHSDGYWRPCDWIPCSDGVSRPAEPISHEVDDGLPAGLGRVRADIVDAIEKEVADALSEDDFGEALLNLQGSLVAQAIQRPPGRLHGVHEAPVLLAFLRQLEEQGRPLTQCAQRAGEETQAQEVRVLRDLQTFARASRERRLDRQSSSESSDAVRVLSSILARYAQAAWGEAFEARAAATHPIAIGVPARVGKLRAYGNAIVPQVAAAFIRAALEAG